MVEPLQPMLDWPTTPQHRRGTANELDYHAMEAVPFPAAAQRPQDHHQCQAYKAVLAGAQVNLKASFKQPHKVA